MRNALLVIGLGLYLVLGSGMANAGPFDQLAPTNLRIAEFEPPKENRFLPGKPRARAGEKKAASRAKSAFPNSKILSVNYVQRNDAYRVKLLSSGGVVKYVFVDSNGEVIE